MFLTGIMLFVHFNCSISSASVFFLFLLWKQIHKIHWNLTLVCSGQEDSDQYLYMKVWMQFAVTSKQLIIVPKLFQWYAYFQMVLHPFSLDLGVIHGWKYSLVCWLSVWFGFFPFFFLSPPPLGAFCQHLGCTRGSSTSWSGSPPSQYVCYFFII